MKKVLYFIQVKAIGQAINFLGWLNPQKASHWAYRLFSEPRKGRLKLNQLPNILQESKLETLIHEGNPYQLYIWEGNEQIILLVHGWESNASRWKKTIPFLKKTGKTIVALDAPAHGLSHGNEFTVPKYASVIATLTEKYNPNVIIGHSIGGAACIYYQYLYQNSRIHKMILLGAPSDLKNLIQNYCSLLSLSSKIQKHLELIFTTKLAMPVDDFSGKKFGSHIDTAVLIAHDTNDPIVSIEEAQKLVSNWKKAIYMETNGLGHSMHQKALYQKIVDFIQQ